MRSTSDALSLRKEEIARSSSSRPTISGIVHSHSFVFSASEAKRSGRDYKRLLSAPVDELARFPSA
jgi:hypothetical protein